MWLSRITYTMLALAMTSAMLWKSRYKGATFLCFHFKLYKQLNVFLIAILWQISLIKKKWHALDTRGWYSIHGWPAWWPPSRWQVPAWPWFSAHDASGTKHTRNTKIFDSSRHRMNPANEERRRREDHAAGVNVVSLKLSWLQQFKMLLYTTLKTGLRYYLTLGLLSLTLILISNKNRFHFQFYWSSSLTGML